MIQTILNKISFKENKILNLVIIVLFLFGSLVLIHANYSVANLPLVILTIIALAHVTFKNKNDLVKDIYLFPIMFIEIVYFFQLLTLIDVTEEKGIVYLAILLHNNLLFKLIPLILAFYLIVRSIGGLRATAIIVPIPFALLTIIDFYVTRFRGNEIIFSDLRSAGTALNVAGGYTFNPILPLALVVVPYALTIICAFNIVKPSVHRRWYERIVFLAAGVLSLSLFVYLTDKYSDENKFETWSYNGAIYNTFYMNFSMSLIKSIIITPSGYDIDVINGYTETAVATLPEDPPNIIVVMNESYMDISLYHDQTGDIEDPDPYWDSLTENAIHGYAFSSVFGGNTANSEYEFLTGLSMADLPSGSVAFNQFIDEDLPCLPRFLDNLGYSTYALHPYYSDSWHRDTIYPLMDFNNMIFAEDFDFSTEDIIRSTVSDVCAYDNLLERCDSNNGLGFYFLITIQNHGGYINDYNGINFTTTNYIDSPSAECINNYLTLIHESDIALEHLINELSNRDEKYVLLIFGDHQPEADYLQTDLGLGGVSWVIPYIIWTNYDMDPALMEELDHTTDYTSINYLSLDLLTVAGITPDPYYDLLYRIRDEVPCINTMGYRLSGESEFHSRDESSTNDMRRLYSYITYDVLFDEEDSAATALG